jgi:hypothetical protein
VPASSSSATARWSLATPPAAGAIALIEIDADTPADLDDAITRLRLRPVPPSALVLRDIPDLDTALVSRPTPTLLHVMPHGGPAVVRALIVRLADAAIAPRAAPLRRPEAASLLESLMLDALALAPSPRAIDLLRAQPALWSAAHTDPDTLPLSTPTPRDHRLARLIHPPLVAAWGPANIGKSTLCNALAGRDAAITADLPGTTRDHVGVTLDLDGLTVRYADTPGQRPTDDPLERRAQAAAADLLRHADLLLLCGDPTTPPLPAPIPSIPALRVCLRADLGTPLWSPDLAVAAKHAAAVPNLAVAVRRALLPDTDLDPPNTWRFWDALRPYVQPT